MQEQNKPQQKIMNIPNVLSIVRMILVPVFMASILYMAGRASLGVWGYIVPAFIFALTSFTDMLDGKIARKYGLVTDFGKFLDPLADKFMVIGAMLVILYGTLTAEAPHPVFAPLFFWGVLIMIFRELAVTSMRLVVSGSSGIVVAANMLGKIKTCTQIACVIACIAEPLFYENIEALAFLADYLPLSILTTALMTVFTLWSGINYIASYWKYLSPEK